MSRLLELERFDVFDEMPGFAPVEPLPDAESVAEAYERGYRAGWDDCERQVQEARQAVGAELARNIQELGFTFHEARAHVLGGLEPLLAGIVAKVLPTLARETIGQSIVEELASVAETAIDAPVTILVAPGSHETVASFLADATALPYRLVAEETLSDGQVFFRLGDHERQLDLGAVIARIGERLTAFADENQKVLKYG
jgi:hypothetical protein